MKLKKNSLPIFLVFCLVLFALLMGCTKVQIKPLSGIPNETYQGIPPVLVHEHTIGKLTEGYIKNTESLITVNGRLNTICEAQKIKNCLVQ